MSSTYNGADVFPTGVTIPDDADAPTASAFNVPLEGIADRTINLKNHSPRVRFQKFTAATASGWTAPARCVNARVTLCGGGGGGAGGWGAATTVNKWFPGGGGGAGALEVSFDVTVVPGSAYDINIGGGGTAGTAGTAGGNAGGAGGDGSDSTFVLHGGATLATGKGAQGGCSLTLVGLVTTSNIVATISPGGNGCSGTPKSTGYQLTGIDCSGGPGAGGPGQVSAASHNYGPSVAIGAGCSSPQGYSGGALSNFGGATSGSQMGGGPGGGGGAGPAGVGGTGGGGGNGNNAGTGVAGTAGTAGAANTGAGGGGGGAGGTGSTAGAAGAAGGAGGSGYVIITWTEDSP
jgi:hypothetical protein